LMVFKLEEKEETTVHNVLNLTPVVLINFSLHTYKFSRRLTYFILFIEYTMRTQIFLKVNLLQISIKIL
jgi:hypothetical protein